MVTNVQDEVTHISKSVVNITRLTSKIAEQMTRYPHTFVILPKPPKAKLGNDASKASKVANYVRNKVFDPIMTLMWDKSLLIFFVLSLGKQLVVGILSKYQRLY